MQIARFDELNLIPALLKALKDEGHTTPTPIQTKAIPPLLNGRDLFGCAQTGTGKTAAFALPILQKIALENKKRMARSTSVLVLTPTRELALQVEESFKKYGRNIPLKTAVIYGGVGQLTQVRSMSVGVDVLVATTGRLLDLIEQGHVSLKNVSTFVLDEADQMLDMGFITDIKKIISMLPSKRQNLFFSATLPPAIKTLADSFLVGPATVEVTPPATTVELIEQSVIFVEKQDKSALLYSVLQDQSIKRVIIFTRTKHGANKVSETLQKNGISSEAIHGNKSQNARQRALDLFKKGQVRALVATDIAARGIDVDNITHVLNYELPNVPESYVHRIGRTARAGAKGMALSFCDTEERTYLKSIERLIGKKISLIETLTLPKNFKNHKPIHSKGQIQKVNQTKRPGQKSSQKKIPDHFISKNNKQSRN